MGGVAMSCDYYSFEAEGRAGEGGWQAEVVGDRQLGGSSACWAGQVDSSLSWPAVKSAGQAGSHPLHGR